jgi:hypothetical protein
MIDERKAIMNLADMMKGEINRMCVTEDLEELWAMEKYLYKNTKRLWELNHDRIISKGVQNGQS